MADHEKVPTDPIDLTSRPAAEHVDRMLDEAIEESFPNSDPVALAMPHDRVESSAYRSMQNVSTIRDAWPLVLVGSLIVALLVLRRH